MTERMMSWSKVIQEQEKKERPKLTPVPDTAPVLNTSAVSDTPAVQQPLEPQYRTSPVSSTTVVPNTTPVLNTPVNFDVDPGKWTGTPNDLEDKIYPTLDPYQARILGRVYRLTWGFHTDTCKVSIPKLAKTCGMGESKARRSIDVLESRGFIKQLEVDLSNKDRNARGVTIKMLLPQAAVRGKAPVPNTTPVRRTAPVQKTDIKEKDFKENNIKGDSPKITRLTPEERMETLQMIADLITKDGYSFEQAENQFGGNLTPEDWTAIRAQVEEKGIVS